MIFAGGICILATEWNKILNAYKAECDTTEVKCIDTMKKIRCGCWLIIFVILVLMTGITLTTWKMFHFRHRLHEFIDNDRWQQTLTANHMYDDNLIVFFGDSQIEAWLMAPSFGSLPIVNKGVSGDWALTALDRFNRDVLDLKPKVIVMLLGTNDLDNGKPIDTIIHTIESMIKKTANQNIRVILCSLLPVRNEHIQKLPLKDLLLFNSRLKILAQQYQIDYVDFFSQLSDKNGLFRVDLTKDGIHPSKSGYLRMSKIILPYLMKNCNKIGVGP